ncbi:DUF4382 domain-containing protein [Zhouia amylolytica]|uniref:DUF4382 domain-containing protein n=1 Tax=Zhouia amylolytica AD3 TaxID=1286632 RepID=W2UL16_9FLAO|nr:DUF4382 domain-containing protein [Zhouia amylolytica]ETN94679.1 hypothetical protein P278_26220 [Zhouia amylolytica AD3]
MKSLKKNLLKTLSLIAFTTLFVACSEDDGATKVDGSSHIVVKLTDAPGDYDAVNIDVQDVMVQYDENGAWESIGEINSGVYDLLELTGGVNVVLADNEVPSGMVDQIRLILGDNNTIVVDGEEIDLDTPSAQQSGLKLKLNQELEAGFSYEFTIDFDADKSIVQAGNSGKYILKPVLRLSAEVSSGIVTGTVTPSDFQSMVSIVLDEETTISAYTDENGVFMLYGVPEGTHDVMITTAEDSGYENALVEGIEVVNGEILDLGTIELEEVTTGSISGKILNEGVSVNISVEVPVEGGEEGEVESISTTTAEDGTFTLEGILPGTYTVTLTPEEVSDLTSKEITDVEVKLGETTVLDDITLE